MTVKTLPLGAAIDDLAAGDKPYMLYFTATWCGPCQQFGPIVERVSDELGEQFTFVKVDLDQHGELAERFDVAGVPSIRVLRGEEVLMSSVGAMSRGRLLHAMRTVADSLAPAEPDQPVTP